MADKTPQQYNGNGYGNDGGLHGQPHAPSSSLGTTAVKRNSFYGLHPLTSHNAQKGGPSFVEPAASSSEPRHHIQDSDNYALQPLSSQDSHHLPNHPYQQHQKLHTSRSYGQPQSDTLASPTDLTAHALAPTTTRNTTGKFTEEWDASQRGSSIIDSPIPRHVRNHNSNSNSNSKNKNHKNNNSNNMSSIQRSNSFSGSASGRGADMDGTNSVLVSRNNTLRKRSSMRRSGSLGRSGSRRSMKAGSVKSLVLQSSVDNDELHSAFYCPVPTKGNPTEALSNRFQAWRKILKDIITYFKEIQTFYEQRSKSFLKLANVLNNVHMPPGFLPSGGLDDAVQVLRNYNSQVVLEANKAREIEEDVILALTGLRTDLQLKIKEIKNLSGDFKNSVEKEMEVTRKAVRILQDALGRSDLDSSLTTGKEDPYLLRLAVDRQLERQLDEENYLHQAYLNLENSGRELESIVVGEIQKSYNAYAGILKREADVAVAAVEDLRVGPIAMPKDHEWANFVQKDEQFVDPSIPIRSFQYIHYPGRNHYACQEVRAGLLERKSKYLKSYTAGWYVLSPTHLHEFKSADKTQSPVMSLYLPDQRLGSHSQESGSSPKFILKGRQTSGVHRSHSWVFRAESYDTMMAWYEDIKALTEKTPEERSEFVRGHSRSFSRASSRVSISSDGVVDEDDEEPYSAHNSAAAFTNGSDYQQAGPRRPSPGGRFPSDIEVNAQRGLQAPLSPSSSMSGRFPSPGPSDSHHDNNVIAAAGALPGSNFEQHYPQATKDYSQSGYNMQSPQPVGYVDQSRQDQFTQHHQTSEAPYANHPATIIAARGVQNNDTVSNGDRGLSQNTSDHEASWLGGGSVEAASIPRADSQQLPQQPAASYASGLDVTGMKEIPQTTVLPINGKDRRPEYSERTESDAPTLSSEVQTISNLHVPGQYPRSSVK